MLPFRKGAMVTRASTPNLFSSDIIYFRRAVHLQDSLVQQTVMNSLWDGMLTKILELKTDLLQLRVKTELDEIDDEEVEEEEAVEVDNCDEPLC